MDCEGYVWEEYVVAYLKPVPQYLPGPGRDADRSFPSSAEVKNAWSCTSIYTYVLMA